MVRTRGSQPRNRGSTPRGGAKINIKNGQIMEQKAILNKNIIIIVGVVVLIIMAYFAFDRKNTKNELSRLNSAALPSQQNITKETNNNSKFSAQQNSQAPGQNNQSNNQTAIKNNLHLITIKTNFGDIKFVTYDADAPKTVNNFITLAQKGFYDNLIFHRVIKGFMIQGGDPNCRPLASAENSALTGPCGTGGPGYQFEDELNPTTDSYKAGYKKGVVAMANAGPNTNGSQFFIMLEDYPLPNNYTIFGKVVSGQEVVDRIGSVATDNNDRPLDAVVMEKVTVTEIK